MQKAKIFIWGASLIAFVLSCLGQDTNVGVSTKGNASIDSQTEALIDELPQISKVEYVDYALFGGLQFPPTLVFSNGRALLSESPTATNSGIIERIVSRGILAAPSLLQHLDDARAAAIPPMSGQRATFILDKYDYNRRLRNDPPTGVNLEETLRLYPSTNYTIKVGDLCFAALGAILNRYFSAAQHELLGGGLNVSSPTISKRLCEVVRIDFAGLTEKQHRESLAQDLLAADSEFRRLGAYRRIAFYYPDMLEPLVLRQLAVPTYDVFKVEFLVRNGLYPNKSPEKRRAMFDEFLRGNGPAFSDGVLLQLFDDLSLEEAYEHHLGGREYDARSLLVQLYGYPEFVSSTNKPYVTHWDCADLARFVNALGQDKSLKVDAAVHAIFKKITDNDYLALACIGRLIGKGYDEEILDYCQRRIPNSMHYATELRAIRSKLDSKTPTDTQSN